jgi:hypothetical protein
MIRTEARCRQDCEPDLYYICILPRFMTGDISIGLQLHVAFEDWNIGKLAVNKTNSNDLLFDLLSRIILKYRQAFRFSSDFKQGFRRAYILKYRRHTRYCVNLIEQMLWFDSYLFCSPRRCLHEGLTQKSSTFHSSFMLPFRTLTSLSKNCPYPFAPTKPSPSLSQTTSPLRIVYLGHCFKVLPS